MIAAMTNPQPDNIFDGGDLDCGSGLILMIRENMLKIPLDGILEMRSSEPTVADDLPPWCRMVGHEYLGSLPAQGSYDILSDAEPARKTKQNVGTC